MRKTRFTISLLISVFVLAVTCLTSAAQAAPTLQLLSPSGGETFSDYIEVAWQASDPVGFPAYPVSLYLSCDDGRTYSTVTSGTNNNGEFNWWGGPVSDTTEARVKIEIKNLDDEITTIESEKFTTVTTPRIYFTGPLPALVTSGTTLEIIWWSEDVGGDLPDDSTNIYYSINDGDDWLQIATGEVNDGSRYWTVPDVETSSAVLKLMVEDEKGNVGTARHWFSISSVPRQIRVIKPGPGEALEAGQTYEIEWSLSNTSDLQNYPYSIYYSTDNGETFTEFAEGLPRWDTFYSWTVPAINSANVILKMTAVDIWGQVIVGTSESFSISMPPIGHLSAPSAGEVLKGGATYEVAWNPLGEGLDPADYSINLKYSVNNGDWEPIDFDEVNDGSCEWAVPAINSSSVKIRVEVLDGSAELVNSSESEDYFSIDSTPPQIALFHPQAGITWEVGSTGLRVAYDVTDNMGLPDCAVVIYYSGDGGETYSWVSSAVNSIDTNWWINAGNDTNEAIIKVEATDLAGWVTTAESEIFNAVTIPSVHISSPAYPDNYWQGGSHQTILWNASDQGDNLAANPITIKYSINYGTSWETVASGEANDGEFPWPVPEIDAAYASLKIEAIDEDGNIGQAINTFHIDSMPPSVTLTAPNGGESLFAGQYFDVSWDSSDTVGIKTRALYYSTDGGEEYSLIDSGYLFSPHRWTVPQINSDNVKIKIEVRDYVGNIATDESETAFNIAIPPFGTVVAPASGESFGSWQTIDIKWQSSDDDINPDDYLINLSYQVDDGDWQPIAADEINDGIYSWSDHSDINSTNIKVKVEAIKDGEVAASDESDGYFSIRSSSNNEITILSPSEGEVLSAGSTYRINWEIDAGVPPIEEDVLNIYMWYVFEETIFTVYITQDVPLNQNYFDWKIPSGINAAAATIEAYAWNNWGIDGRSAAFSIVASPEIVEVIVTKEVQAVEEIEYADANGNKISVPVGAVSGAVDFEIKNAESPKEGIKGTALASGIIEITSSIDTFAEPASITLKLNSEVSNPRAYHYDPVDEEWSADGLAVVSQGEDSVTFTTSHLSIFAVFDVLDTASPEVTAVSVDGVSLKDGDLITTMPSFKISIEDDYSLDTNAVQIVLDNAQTITVADGISVSQVSADSTLFSMNYTFSEGNKLTLGDHTFEFVVRDEIGNSSSYEITLNVVGDSLLDIYVYPNPYSLSDTLGIEFAGDMLNNGPGTIRVYDIVGQLVWSQAFTQVSGVTWDAKNNSGKSIASGIYIYLVTTSSGGKKIGKIAINN
ncbi:T9SS type A sorting domain-containing protein [Candidatus Margulisiibacteriota bacterium]